MGVWKPDGVDIEPEITLSSFAVMELPDGSRHLVGRRMDEDTGRVSSSVVTVDAEKRVAITRSGRLYRLGQAMAELTGEATYVWGVWCDLNGVDAASARNVTAEIFNT